MKVLVVDDHPLICEALRQVLKALDRDIELLEAGSGRDALAQAARSDGLDLILLDLALPDADGFEVLRQLRERHPSFPVVVLSASEQAQIVMRALDAGAMGFIPKTASNEVLLGALRLVLSGGVYLPAEVLRHAPSPALPASPAAAETGYRAMGLTERQAQVLALVVQGKPNKIICRELDLAEGTVKIHVTAILKALGVSNRTEAVVAVGKLGLKLPTAA
ncbi:MAG TPA: response regulator transcription factor [Burkholderiales bacterium]|nr:response regulator transcription factor [Burkholderiales bacterium]